MTKKLELSLQIQHKDAVDLISKINGKTTLTFLSEALEYMKQQVKQLYPQGEAPEDLSKNLFEMAKVYKDHKNAIKLMFKEINNYEKLYTSAQTLRQRCENDDELEPSNLQKMYDRYISLRNQVDRLTYIIPLRKQVDEETGDVHFKTDYQLCDERIESFKMSVNKMSANVIESGVLDKIIYFKYTDTLRGKYNPGSTPSIVNYHIQKLKEFKEVTRLLTELKLCIRRHINGALAIPGDQIIEKAVRREFNIEFTPQIPVQYALAQQATIEASASASSSVYSM